MAVDVLRSNNAERYSSEMIERSQIGTKVKLSGYLKKKRNKVGGWRRMWFVLQDKLLLSYGSKEEYDKKLVSFKDVLNLVPGTLVRPLSGQRFTIETTTNALYTFHCDDQMAYRTWIETLLDSLATKKSLVVSHHHPAMSRFHGFLSMENISDTVTTGLASVRANFYRRDLTGSYDSVTQVERTLPPAFATDNAQPPAFRAAVCTHNCANLPIAHATAKLLERNGYDERSYSYFHTRECNSDASQGSSSLLQLKEQIHRLSIKGSSDEFVHNEDDGNRMRTVNTSKHLTIDSHIENTVYHKSMQSAGKTPVEPIYAVVDLQYKNARRKLRNSEFENKRCNSYDSIMQLNPDAKDLDATKPKQPLKAADSIEDDLNKIYEDGDNLYLKIDNTSSSKIVDEENIYEPINILTPNQDNFFWKYFKRLKMNSLLHLKRTNRITPDYDNIRFSSTVNTAANSSLKTKSHLSTMRHKFGSHRKSIQLRMRKLCLRAYEPKTLFNNLQVHTSLNGTQTDFNTKCAERIPTGPTVPSQADTGGAMRYPWRSIKVRAKKTLEANGVPQTTIHLFGSLPRARKSRCSLYDTQNRSACTENDQKDTNNRDSNSDAE